MLENKIKNLINSRNFLIFSCAAIFLISIFLRSLADIGSDTGVYIALGEKIAQGQKYYYDFFENNFPLSFYFYALEYQISKLLHINPIIFSEITINLLALLSIFWSAKILQTTTLYENKAHYNLIIIGFFLGFFLRTPGLEVTEFGTKTSLLLIALFPYIAYCLPRLQNLDNKNLIYRGCLMGLMPCLKPHYIIFVIFIELHNFLKTKSLKFFYELDKLTMYAIGMLYIVLLLKFIPEFFELVIPMVSKIYSAYGQITIFFDNFIRHLATRVLVFSFIFLMFSRLNFSENDKILALFFAAASCILVLENIGTIDQVSIFFAVATICFVKFLFDLLSSEEFSFTNNKFIIAALMFIPLFEHHTLPAAILGLGGFVNIWWLLIIIYPFILGRKLKKEKPSEWLILKAKYLSTKKIFAAIIIYFLLLYGAVLTLQIFGGWKFIALNLIILFVVLFFFEKKIYAAFFPHFSPFFTFIVITASSCLFYSYVTSIIAIITKDNPYLSPNKLSDAMAYYTKTFAPQKDEKTLTFSVWIAHNSPISNYLEKQYESKLAIVALEAEWQTQNRVMFFDKDFNKVFAMTYFFNNIKTQIKNPQTKVLFFNIGKDSVNTSDRCLVNPLEYYFLDPEFKKLFLENFHFENHLLLSKKIKPLKKIGIISGEKSDIFDQAQPTTKKIIYDFEVYVRNEN